MITEADFCEFIFENTPRLHTALNPDFFKGTVSRFCLVSAGWCGGGTRRTRP